MSLVDTSLLIDHLWHGDAELSDALNPSQMWVHPFVLEELACGDLKSSASVLALLGTLPASTPFPFLHATAF